MTRAESMKWPGRPNEHHGTKDTEEVVDEEDGGGGGGRRSKYL
jgi:hypothetical protein